MKITIQKERKQVMSTPALNSPGNVYSPGVLYIKQKPGKEPKKDMVYIVISHPE